MTSETLKDPTAVIHPNPTDFDLAITQINAGLSNLTWLQKVFGRAREHSHKTADGKQDIKIPQVYVSGGEYYPVLPNDALNSYSFWRAENSKDFTDYVPNAGVIYGSTESDLIVWGNLKQIDSSKDYIFTDELINDVVRVLNISPYVIKINRIFDEKPDEIFSGYTLDPTHRDLLMYPYQAFRIEMTLQYEIKCTP